MLITRILNILNISYYFTTILVEENIDRYNKYYKLTILVNDSIITYIIDNKIESVYIDSNKIDKNILDQIYINLLFDINNKTIYDIELPDQLPTLVNKDSILDYILLQLKYTETNILEY